MTIDTAFNEAMKWLKRLVAIAFLAVIAVTAVELLGWNIPSVKGLDLTQGVGIGAAGIGFLLSKL